jgi:hypothetical protein
MEASPANLMVEGEGDAFRFNPQIMNRMEVTK